MPDTAERALLFLDVDGPLIPFGAPPPGKSSTHGRLGSASDPISNPLLPRLNRDDGRRLLALECDLVWATTWMAEANEVIAPLIGLPDAPCMSWSDTDDPNTNGLHWKTRDLVHWAAGRRFVWIDDEITDSDRTWVSAHHPGAALLHRVDPRYGLTATDFVAIAEWLNRTHETNHEGLPAAKV